MWGGEGDVADELLRAAGGFERQQGSLASDLPRSSVPRLLACAERDDGRDCMVRARVEIESPPPAAGRQGRRQASEWLVQPAIGDARRQEGVVAAALRGTAHASAAALPSGNSGTSRPRSLPHPQRPENSAFAAFAGPHACDIVDPDPLGLSLLCQCPCFQ